MSIRKGAKATKLGVILAFIAAMSYVVKEGLDVDGILRCLPSISTPIPTM